MKRGVEPARRLRRPASGDLTPVGRVRHGDHPSTAASGWTGSPTDRSISASEATAARDHLSLPTALDSNVPNSEWQQEYRTHAEITRRDATAAPQVHFGRGPVAISLIRAVRTHALCMHTQEGLGGRRPTAIRHEPAAHRLRLAAHTLHRHAYAALSRPREIHPRKANYDATPNAKQLVTALCIRKRARRTRRTSGGGRI
jgi:hypothetical protein